MYPSFCKTIFQKFNILANHEMRIERITDKKNDGSSLKALIVFLIKFYLLIFTKLELRYCEININIKRQN